MKLFAILLTIGAEFIPHQYNSPNPNNPFNGFLSSITNTLSKRPKLVNCNRISYFYHVKFIFSITFLLLFACSPVHGQTGFFERDTSFNKSRVIGTSVTAGAFWAGSIIALKEVWYKDSWSGEFHTFDDANQWMQMDKAGHVFAGSFITDNVYHTYRWSGVNKKTSLILGSVAGVGYLASFEMLDGFSDEWGFSWSDLTANGIGVGWFAAQELLWNEQRIKLKFSAHLSSYAKYRPNILGSSLSERLLKDYNGQTYWLSVNPSMFMSSTTRFPKWLSISLGYSVDEKLRGVENIFYYADSESYEIFNARRQYLLSLDVDLTRIPVKKPWLKTIFKALNHIKLPFPAVEFSNSGVSFHGLYF